MLVTLPVTGSTTARAVAPDPPPPLMFTKGDPIYPSPPSVTEIPASPLPVGASNARDVPIEFPPESIFAPPELIVIRSIPLKKLLEPVVACTVPPLKFRYCVPDVLETPIEAVLVNPPLRFTTEPPEPA